MTGCRAAGLLGLMSTSAFGESYLSLRLALFGLYEAAALVALQAASEHLAPAAPHDTSLPGLVSPDPCLCSAGCMWLEQAGGRIVWGCARRVEGAPC